MQKVLSHNFIF